MNESEKGRLVGRREFIRGGAIAGLGLGLMPLASTASAALESQPQVRRYSTLGRTGIKMSDISFGGSRLSPGDEDVVRHAFDRGINYFDSAEDYGGGVSETTIGNALKGKRDKVYFTSKVITTPSDRNGMMMRALEGSLRRLQTDHVDVYFNHAVNDVERLKTPEWYEFVAQAKAQGKIRFSGVSGHGPRLIECLDYAIDGNRVDVILCAYNFGQDPRFYQRFFPTLDFVARQPDLPRVIRKAKAKGIGVVTMKTLMGARLNDLRPYERGGATFSQAAFRWVLSNPDVDALIVSMMGVAQIDEYLGASGWRTASIDDLPLLGRYVRLNGKDYCRHGCAICEDSCPYGVPISDVLRTRMYAKDYRDMRLARDEYAMLGAGAAACLTCSAKPCAGACPHGIAIETAVGATHAMLAG